MRPRLLDLFCGAGGCAKGYQRAGFYVVGVDIEAQANYCGDAFVQADAITTLRRLLVWGDFPGLVGSERSEPFYRLSDFSAIHASPPCQAYLKGLRGVNVTLGREQNHVDLIAETREMLKETGLPYVIENVVGAPLENAVQLCGSSFNLAVRRHRRFECSFEVLVPPCDHSRQNGDHWTSWRPNGEVRRSKVVQVYGNAGDSSEWASAMGIDWMTREELTQAIPPDYTEHIGNQLLQHVRAADENKRADSMVTDETYIPWA